MAAKLLESGALSAFCGSVATMLSAGMQVDEAVHLLCLLYTSDAADEL